MTKLITAAAIVEIEDEDEVFTPLPDLREMTPFQAEMMRGICRMEATQKTGYDPIPIEVLRNDRSIHDLLDMLETCRPGRSDDEEDFITGFIDQFKPTVDDYGNRVVVIPTPEGHPAILWSCHTDTVHRHGGMQKVEVTDGVAWTSNGSCLGSDDTVGIWLAMEMMKAGVPGAYVFHRDEESGGGGSRFMAREESKWLGQFQCAIALDRMGYGDVITYQGGARCASDAFAKSLAAILGGKFEPCDGGVFTDTANYVDDIGECTNLSVGYFRQHGSTEHTNLSFAASLRDALVNADWTKLVFERKPGEVESYGRWADYGYRDYGTKRSAAAYGSKQSELDALEQFVSDYPWVVAQYLYDTGVSVDDLDLYEPEDDRL